MRVLVTGSSGLLGRCLAERLRERGDELCLVDLEPLDADAARSLGGPRCLTADVSRAGALDDAVRGVEVIHHLAAAQRMKPQFSAWSEQEIFELFPDCEVGAQPPFGNLYGLAVFVSPELAANEFITFNGGTHEDAVRLRYEDFQRLAQPAVLDIVY